MTWDEPYLESCCRSALHRLFLAGRDGRPAGQRDGSCLRRLEGIGLVEPRPGDGFRITEAGRARHAREIAPR